MGTPALDAFQDRENLYGPRVIVFIAGGASHSEIKVLEELLNKQVNLVKDNLEADAKFLDGVRSFLTSPSVVWLKLLQTPLNIFSVYTIFTQTLHLSIEDKT